MISRLQRGLAAGASRPNLRSLRIVAFTGPVLFAIGVGLLTDQVLEHTLSRSLAHVAATVIVATGALIFTLWMFSVLTALYDRLEEAARLEERQRIAMKLHDDVIQSVYGVQLTLEASLKQLQQNSPADHQTVDQAVEHLDRIVVRVRQHILEEDLETAGPHTLAQRTDGHKPSSS